MPTALVASTFPLAVVRQMIGEGHPFFTGLAGGQLLELPTGHWPMLSEPKALADARPRSPPLTTPAEHAVRRRDAVRLTGRAAARSAACEQRAAISAAISAGVRPSVTTVRWPPRS